MLKKLLVIIPCISLIFSHTTHAVHILDALNHFLHSTAPKVDREYPYTNARTKEECEVIYNLRREKIMEYAIVSSVLTACVFKYVMYKSRNG